MKKLKTLLFAQATIMTASLYASPVPTPPENLMPFIKKFPQIPSPLIIRDWKATSMAYHRMAFNPSISGDFLPLLNEYRENTDTGYSGPAFSLPSYINKPHRTGGEALAVLGAVLGGTLSGLDMASLNEVDRVRQCEKYFVQANGHGTIANRVDADRTASAWYSLFPSTLFFHIGSHYPAHHSFHEKMRATADSWLAALPVLSGNWEHKGFDFSSMTPTDGLWIEPDMAIGIAWIEYMAYLRFGDEKYLTAAKTCMTQMNQRTHNPLYEILAYYGPALAARMNAELDQTYSVSKHLNWVFDTNSAARPGWGCIDARWGDYDAYGLMGSTTDTDGYAFSMNSFTAAGLIAPLVRYEPRYARILGRWLLHMAANANLFYPNTLPSDMQANADWVKKTGIQSVAYEGVRNLGFTTPYATGDRKPPELQLNPYGAWGCGFMAALFETSNIPGILKIDCVATEAFPPKTYPTFLYYNPYPTAQQIELDAGEQPKNLYDAVTSRFIQTNASGRVVLNIEADAALVLVHVPAGDAVHQNNRKLIAGNTVIDYQYKK